MLRLHVLAAATSVICVGVTGCGSSSVNAGPTTAPAGAGSALALTGTITVLAAASLTGTFTQLGKQFESAHPGVTVRFSFGASSTLVSQIAQGAPADVFASASPKNMDSVVKAGEAGAATTFAVNRMEIAVPAANPAGITRLADLAEHSVKVALCQAQVPCGATAAKVFANAKLTVKPVTLEADVKSALAKVTLGEVDAAVVYVTDVLAAGNKVKAVPIPDDVNASTDYSLAALTHAKDATLAQAFVAYVLSAAGRSVLTAAGFGSPS